MRLRARGTFEAHLDALAARAADEPFIVGVLANMPLEGVSSSFVGPHHIAAISPRVHRFDVDNAAIITEPRGGAPRLPDGLRVALLSALEAFAEAAAAVSAATLPSATVSTHQVREGVGYAANLDFATEPRRTATALRAISGEGIGALPLDTKDAAVRASKQTARGYLPPPRGQGPVRPNPRRHWCMAHRGAHDRRRRAAAAAAAAETARLPTRGGGGVPRGRGRAAHRRSRRDLPPPRAARRPPRRRPAQPPLDHRRAQQRGAARARARESCSGASALATPSLGGNSSNRRTLTPRCSVARGGPR